MEEININHLHKDMLKLQRDIALIKHILMEERELTDWAKEELARAREEPEENYVDLEDL